MKALKILKDQKARIKNMDNKKIKQSEYSEAEQHLQATNWKYYLKACIKNGLESPTPYKVIPYKNGIGIKKTEIL
jgi:hypothetical protein